MMTNQNHFYKMSVVGFSLHGLTSNNADIRSDQQFLVILYYLYNSIIDFITQLFILTFTEYYNLMICQWLLWGSLEQKQTLNAPVCVRGQGKSQKGNSHLIKRAQTFILLALYFCYALYIVCLPCYLLYYIYLCFNILYLHFYFALFRR